MALHIIHYRSQHLDQKVLLSGVSSVLRDCPRAQILCASHDAARSMVQGLVDHTGRTLVGCEGTTWSSWIESLWHLWGDGRTLISSAERRAQLMLELRDRMHHDERAVSYNLGLLAQLAEMGIGILRAQGEVPSCTAAEEAFLQMLDAYHARLEAAGVVESSQVLDVLCEAFAKGHIPRVPLVVMHAEDYQGLVQRFLVRLAAYCDVTLIIWTPWCLEAARYQPQEAYRVLAQEHSIAYTESSLPDSSQGEDACGITALAQHLFGAATSTLTCNDALRILHPAGITARSEGVIQAVAHLMDQGDREIALLTSNPSHLFESLLSWCASHEVDVVYRSSQLLTQTSAGRAVYNLFSAAAHLLAAAATQERTSEDLPLGDMSWWPLRELSDVLRHPLAVCEREKATAFDVYMRSTRTLRASDVLSYVSRTRNTSAGIAGAFRELHLGRVRKALVELARPLRAQESDAAEVAEILDAIQCVDGLVEALLSAYPHNPRTLSDVAALLRDLLELMDHTSVAVDCMHTVDRPAARLVCTQSSFVQQRGAQSFDAVILLEHTSVEHTIPERETLLRKLTELYGIQSIDPLEQERMDLLALISAARSHIVVEQLLFDPEGKKAYPSVMLRELLSAFGVEHTHTPQEYTQILGDTAVTFISEYDVMRNLLHTSASEEASYTECYHAEEVSEALRESVVCPTSAKLEHPVIRLSASQIEQYHMCPYKWFVTRRLNIRDVRSDFSGIEIGMFMHKVLEESHRELKENGLLKEVTDKTLIVSQVQDIYLKHFDAIQCAQYDDAQFTSPLVAHNDIEAQRYAGLRSDVASLAAYNVEHFEGFEPYDCELRFGYHEDVWYAGARVCGSIDRVDVDREGRALIIDYKHKKPSALMRDYKLWNEGDASSAESFQAPQHIQTLMYAQILRRLHPELNVVGALYLSTMAPHALNGIVAEPLREDQWYLPAISREGLKKVIVPSSYQSVLGSDASGFYAYLDDIECALTPQVEALLAGHIPAEPTFEKASCEYCPVQRCKKRIQS